MGESAFAMWIIGKSRSLCSPALAVEAAVADGFGDVGGLYGVAAIEVGNGAGHLEDAVVGTGREVEALHGTLQHGTSALVGLGILLQQTRSHLRIAVYSLFVLEALLLYLACGNHSLAYGCAGLALACVGYFFEGHRYNLYLQVYTIGYFKVR